MTEIIEPKPEFQSLTEAEVTAALNTRDPQNPIILEVTRLLQGYGANFKAHCERLGYIPPAIIHKKPSCPIEAVAMRLLIKALSQTTPKTSH